MDIYTPRLGRESEELLFDEFNPGSGNQPDYVDFFHNLDNYKNNNDNKNNPIDKSFG